MKGATPWELLVGRRAHVSIHAPVKGATYAEISFYSQMGGFNPRAREGRDIWTARFLALYFVSIHAPVKGAT